jgi:hypothetical protein
MASGGLAWLQRPAVALDFDFPRTWLETERARLGRHLPPGRGEALSTGDVLHAHLWGALLRARRERGTAGARAALWQAANLRARLDPSLAPGYLGNAILACRAELDPGAWDLEDVAGLAGHLRGSLQESLRPEALAGRLAALREAQRGGTRWRDLMYLPRYHEGEVSTTSWARFPFGEVDFGTGPPAYGGPPPSAPPFAGHVFLAGIPGPGPAGVRATVGLHPEEMEAFRRQLPPLPVPAGGTRG